LPKASYSQAGYKVTLTGSAEEIVDELKMLQKYEFLGGSTRGVFVEMTAYFPGTRLFALVSILFEISEADVEVQPFLSVRVSDLRRHSSNWLIMDVVVFGAAMFLMLLDLFKMARGLKKFFSTHVFWKVLSWINYTFFAFSFVDLLRLEADTANVKTLVPLSSEAAAYPWLDRFSRMDSYRNLVAVNGLLSWLRLIRYTEQISPSFKQLSGTVGC